MLGGEQSEQYFDMSKHLDELLSNMSQAKLEQIDVIDVNLEEVKLQEEVIVVQEVASKEEEKVP